MRDTPYVVQPRISAHAEIRLLSNFGERAAARRSLLDRTPFPSHFATREDAEQAASAAGPEFEVVVQS